MIFYDTSDPAYHTNAPSGTLAGSGWQYEGQWGGFLGTPIASNLFLTAKHVGGTVGAPFLFQGASYPAIDSFTDPASDLAIWKVYGVLPLFAPLYSASDEVGKSLVVFGRGASRGDALILTNQAGPVLKGWFWGTDDGLMRWGANVVEAVVDGGVGFGPLLEATFDPNTAQDVPCLAGGDSGGAVFLPRGPTWALAGINYAVTGPYNTTNNGPGFEAAVFDGRGLYLGGEGNWQPIPNGPVAEPGASYATRVSAHLAWITNIIATQSTTVVVPVLQTANAPAGPYVDAPAATVDPVAQTLTFPAPASNQFYRLRYWRALRLVRLTPGPTDLQLQYQ